MKNVPALVEVSPNSVLLAGSGTVSVTSSLLLGSIVCKKPDDSARDKESVEACINIIW